jgi:methylated-DNA-protein-cysteine methyltransferase-like protein
VFAASARFQKGELGWSVFSADPKKPTNPSLSDEAAVCRNGQITANHIFAANMSDAISMSSRRSTVESYDAIYATVRRIPYGRVSSYGRIALLAGYPRQARLVGYALHALRSRAPTADVPWWRVINRNGFISNVYEATLQRELLEAEGVAVSAGDRVDLEHYLWDGDV